MTTKKEGFFQNLISEGLYNNIVDTNGKPLSKEDVRVMDKFFNSLMNEDKTKQQNDKKMEENYVTLFDGTTR